MHVINHQDVDRTEGFLEVERVLLAQRPNEAVHELFCRQVQDFGVRKTSAQFPSNGVHQVRLTKTDPTIKEQRVEGHIKRFGHAARGSVGKLVWFADNKIREGERRVQVGAGQIGRR